MKFELLKHFVTEGIIGIDTEVKLSYNKKTLDGKKNVKVKDYFFIEEITEQKNNFSMKLRNIYNGDIIYEISDNIIGIDGMINSRFCQAFNFDISGNKISNKKKTGKKAKTTAEAGE